jgi:uncharacterized protein (DUF1778 family)
MQTKDQQLQIRVSAAQKADIQRAAARAGLDVTEWVLNRLLPPAGRRFRELTRTLVTDPGARRYTLAALNDFLSGLTAKQLEDATAEPPPANLPPYWANYVVAMVETATNRKGVRAPSWGAAIAPLDEPVFGADSAALRLHLLTASPPAFRRRKIFIDSTVGDRV